MKDCKFPFIVYPSSQSAYERGCLHGESFREAIHELFSIRKTLLFKKSPHLEKINLNDVTTEMLAVTEKYDLPLVEELRGIAAGAALSLSDIVILNSYTDIRDLSAGDQGCTTACLRLPDRTIAGQTWDMHNSAKNYLCVIGLESEPKKITQMALSLVGSVGLMGIGSSGVFVGVNNLNTKGARAGFIWPALIRYLLKKKNLQEMRATLDEVPLASGRNFLLADPSSGGLMVEAVPGYTEVVADTKNDKIIFHTNHCVSANDRLQRIEDKKSLSSTTLDRYKRFSEKREGLDSFEDMVRVFKNHDGFPKSICSHYQSGDIDPSSTCGGGVADLKEKRVHFWRGCQQHDANYKSYTLTWKEGGWIL